MRGALLLCARGAEAGEGRPVWPGKIKSSRVPECLERGFCDEVEVSALCEEGMWCGAVWRPGFAESIQRCLDMDPQQLACNLTPPARERAALPVLISNV